MSYPLTERYISTGRLSDDPPSTQPLMTREQLRAEYEASHTGPCKHCQGPCKATRWDYHCESCGDLIGPETGSWHYCSARKRMAHAERVPF